MAYTGAYMLKYKKNIFLKNQNEKSLQKRKESLCMHVQSWGDTFLTEKYI